ncbi:zinc finger C2HC domain-containing protein 1C [Sebastes umbrosus]|uniref:zinc finger C2HC domain-containing protein 1C n=1 Tax=Sebastes umbrosus TaxID=72105 RepID=UPI00189D7A8E|nr:zinc finger C2HC domain-containing protein 1C [Sebastes umbrosus]
MARAIHAKQLILQEKLWSVEEKIRQKIRRDAAAGDVQKSEEQRHDRGRAERGNTQTKSRPSEQQRREPVRGREMMMQERGQEDVKQLRKTQDQRNEDSMRNTHEEERARGKRREIEVAQSQRKGHKGTHRITVPQKEVSGELYKSRPELRELRQETSTDAGLQLLPCTVCNRKFTSERLDKHVQICTKFKQSHRPVFNSYVSRTKGSAIEQFWKTHSRSKSPEVGQYHQVYIKVLKKKNQRQNHNVNTRNLHEGRLPAGTSQPKWSK